MARTEHISWTLVPNGVADGKIRFALAVAPRLGTDEAGPEFRPLEQWPDFLDWPNKIIGANFEVVFEDSGGAEIGAVKATRVSPDPSKALWQYIFNTTTPVRPFLFERFDLKFFFSNAHFQNAGFLRDLYTRFARLHPEEHPSIDDLLDTANVPNLRDYYLELSDVVPGLEQRLRDAVNDHNAVQPGDFSEPRMFIHMLRRFLQPLTPDVGHDDPLPPKEPDFHEVLSSMTDYSILRRKLGLVIDLEVDKADMPAGTLPTSSERVYVRPTWTPEAGGPDVTDFTPRTAYILDNTNPKFMPDSLPGGPQINEGMQILDKDDFEVVQIDPDGATERIVTFVHNLIRRARHATDDTPEDYAVPAPRTQGLSLVEAFNAWKILVRTIRDWFNEQQLEAGQPENVILYAEDLVQGYVVDVHAQPPTGGGAWYSLCQRTGTYEFPDDTSLNFAFPDDGEDDEAFVHATGFGAAGSADDSELHYTDSRFLWQGWSLATEPPGMTISADPDALDTPAANLNEPDPAGFNMKVSYAAKKGSLPRLRFGWTYRFRLRAMYLSGDVRPGPKHESYPDDFTNATNPVTYRQFEPVPSPTLIYGTEKTTGEDLERMVIRSPEKAPTAEETVRWIAPPKAGQRQCEQHAKFDTAAGNLDAAAYDMIVAREKGSFSPIPEPHDKNDPPPVADPDVVFPGPILDFEVEGGAHVQLPYLADPLARHAMFRAPPEPPVKTERFESIRGLPSPDGSVPSPVTFGPKGDWPSLAPFRIRLIEGANTTSWTAPVADTSSGLLTVALAKGERVRLRLNSAFNSDDKDLLALWAWMSAGLDTEAPALLAFLAALVDGARHYMITPFRELLLIHATKQPLQDPAFLGLDHQPRLAGSTFAELFCNPGLMVHAPTTASVYIRARWNERVDVLEEPGPRTINDVRADVFEVPVRYLGNTKQPIMTKSDVDAQPEKFRHEFGDTKYRKVFYTAEAVSRDAEYFRTSTDVTFVPPDKSVSVDPAGVVAESEVVTSQDKSTTYEREQHYNMDYAAGTITRINRLDGIGDADKVQVSYIPTPITRTSAHVFREAKQVELSVADPSETLDPNGVVEDSEIVSSKPDKLVRYRRDRDYEINYATGVLTRLDGGSIGNPETVQVSYIAVPSPPGSEETKLEILNSARPAAPNILYVIPTFRWEEEEGLGPDQMTRHRRGGGLRVYMDRPWYSSGEGEQLAAVLYTSSAGELPERFQSLVTQWGLDPLWGASEDLDPLGAFRPNSTKFPNRDHHMGGLTLEELPGGDNVVAVGHQVEFDATRKLWFCDIDVDTRIPGSEHTLKFDIDSTSYEVAGPQESAYYPFIRLALARYQPNSEPDAHLSRVILADFAQLAPDRTVSTIRVDASTLRVILTGPSPAGDTAGADLYTSQGRSTVVVTTEELVSASEMALPEKGGADEGWMEVGGATNLLSDFSPGDLPFVVWQGDVALPAVAGDLRLVIREFERYEGQNEWDESRVVFADTVEL